MEQLLPQFLKLIALVAIGAALKSAQILPPLLAPALNALVINVTLPATVLSAVRQAHDKGAQVGWGEFKITLIALIIISISASLAFALSRLWLHLPRRTEGTFVLVTMFGSTAFIALPIIQGLYPPQNPNSGPPLLAALFYSELGTLIPLVTVGVLIASLYGEAEDGKQFGWRTLLAIPKSAPFIWLIIGLLFYTDEIPQGVTDFLAGLSQVNAYLVFLALGLTIVWQDIGRWLRPLLALNLIKLILAPVLGVLLARLLGVSSNVLNVVVIESAVPAVLLGISYANQYKLDVEFASTAVFSSFIFSVVTLPAVGLLLGVH
jgi:predicted permease